MGRIARPPIDRFMEKVVQQPNGCWLWTAARFDTGYGAFRLGEKQRRAHRWAYEHFVGPIDPPDACILHSCDVKHCVNPEHLFLGTHIDNMADMVAKGRAASGLRNGAVANPAKLTAALVADIRRRYALGGVRQKDLAAEYGVEQTMISMIILRKRWNR